VVSAELDGDAYDAKTEDRQEAWGWWLVLGGAELTGRLRNHRMRGTNSSLAV
jgi:hypothetical protein